MQLAEGVRLLWFGHIFRRKDNKGHWTLRSKVEEEIGGV